MEKVLIVAPHPDDEVLGAGGTLLRHKELGDEIYWCIVTEMPDSVTTLPRLTREVREKQIRDVAEAFGFDGVFRLGFQSTKLGEVPESSLVCAFSDLIAEVMPTVIYLPHEGDIHGDHRAVFRAAISSSKWFRFSYVKKIFVYETLSETECGFGVCDRSFIPNVFVDISKHLDKKKLIAMIYDSELGDFPFPRSIEAIDALAKVRGCASGFRSAESFMLLRERVN